MSASPFCTSRSCAAGSSVCRMTVRPMCGFHRRMRIGLQDDLVGGRPVHQAIAAGTRAVRLQPGIAQIAVGLVRHHHGLLHHAADRGGQAVQHEGAGLRLREFQLQDILALGGDHLLDVVGVPAELGQDEAGRLVELHHALQAECHVVGRQRLAALEQHALADLEGEGQTVLADLPLLREITHQLVRIGGSGTISLRYMFPQTSLLVYS